MRNLKRLTTVLTALAVCAGALSMFASVNNVAIYAEANVPSVVFDNLLYTETDNGYVLTGCADTSVTTVSIPAQINGKPVSIRYDFQDCPDLQEVLTDEAQTRYSSIDGALYAGNGLLCCPRGKSGSYVIPEGTVQIGEKAFAGCSQLTEITVPDSVTWISPDAFEDCTSLQTIHGTLAIPSVTAIQKCPQLKNISVYNMDEFQLSGMKNLETVEIAGNGYFRDYFYLIDCPALRSVHTAIDYDDLHTQGKNSSSSDVIVENCGMLQELYLPPYARQVTVTGCPSLETLTIRTSGRYTITDCPSLKKVLFYTDNPYQIEQGYFTESPDLVVYGFPDGETKAVCEKMQVNFHAFGDTDENEAISILDVLTLNKNLLGLEPLTDAQKTAADVNGDGVADSVDALNILRYVVKVIDSFDEL